MLEGLEKEIERYKRLRFLASNNIYLPNYEQILELNTSVSEAIAISTKEYTQFLLSSKVNYYELYKEGLKGGRGFIDANEIIIPKSLDGDDYFLNYAKPIVPYQIHGYIFPRDLREFDLTISQGISEQDFLLQAIAKGNITNYTIYDILDLDDYEKIKQIEQQIQRMRNFNIEFEMNYETEANQGYYLLKTPKK